MLETEQLSLPLYCVIKEHVHEAPINCVEVQRELLEEWLQMPSGRVQQLRAFLFWIFEVSVRMVPQAGARSRIQGPSRGLSFLTRLLCQFGPTKTLPELDVMCGFGTVISACCLPLVHIMWYACSSVCLGQILPMQRWCCIYVSMERERRSTQDSFSDVENKRCYQSCLLSCQMIKIDLEC